MASLSAEEKERLLKALEEDRELRYALMGLLGYKEILDRITRIEERITKLEERFARLEERQQKLEERQQKLEERLERLDRTLATVAHRFGVMSESAFREAIKGILEKYFGASASRWSRYDEEGLVYGYPSIVEVDVVGNGVHVLVEVKSRVDPGDILELVRIGKFYEKSTGVKPKLAIVGGFVSPRAREVAAKLGVDIYSYLEEHP